MGSRWRGNDTNLQRTNSTMNAPHPLTSRPSLADLENAAEFHARHIGPSEDEIAAMLRVVGQPSLEALTDAIVPASIKLDAPLALPAPLTEVAALDRLKAIAAKNQVFKSFIGQGYYGTHTPKVILRNILENPAWYTAYTPYQAEISQGRMEALINFQTLVCDLTGMQISNASLLDEATAAAEAMTLAKRSCKSRSNLFLVSADCHPQTIEVVRTRAEPLGLEVRIGDEADLLAADAFGVLLQYPATTGEVRDLAAIVAAVHARGGLVAVAADLLALTLLKAPGEWGADMVVGNSQRFGVPFGFGGPHAAFLACKDAFKRSMPGRLVGVSVDSQGKPAYRLTLQTREQHIRREKATSNICTAQVLLAVMASMYAVYHGPAGLKRIARRVHRLASIFAEGLRQNGIRVNAGFFDTVKVGGVNAASVHAAARAQRINLRDLGRDAVGVSFDETSTRADVETLWSLFGARADLALVDSQLKDDLPAALLRTSDYLTHPVFNAHHSEHEMLRYLRSLADKDLALDRTMIPLGSCTMKLNATSEMIPVTWPEFCNIHPLAPAEQTQGYQEMISTLEAMLVECTGYDAVSLQPNSGAQGEYAGLLAIRAYHRARGEGHRTICLIPESAHGTGGANGHLSLHARCVRGGDRRDLRRDPPARRAGLHGRGQSQRTGGAGQAGQVRLGRVAPEPAQDLLHPARRRRPGRRAGGGARAPGALPALEIPSARSPGEGRGAGRGRHGQRRALRQRRHPADQLDVHRHDGRRGAAPGHAGGAAVGQLHRPPARAADVAKRLMDYGFHAPTLSFPVAGTLMVEPTESEPKGELDRFIDAMIAIRAEIRAVEEGRIDKDDNPLKNAPHTAAMVMAETWAHDYTREQAAFPLPSLKRQKYWPLVGRVDNVYGDRNIMCSCVPMEAYQEEAAAAQ